MDHYKIAEFILMLAGACFGVAIACLAVAAAVYYFIEGNE
jgi:hypothetical protein